MRVIIRPVGAEDAAAVNAVRLACAPHSVSTTAAVLYKHQHPVPQARGRLAVADVDGRAVGFANAELSWESSEPGQGVVTLMVDPRFRGRGVGTVLARAAEDHLRAIGATVLRAWALGGSEWFAERDGCAPRSVARHLELELLGLPPVPPRPHGVELWPFAVYRDDPRPVHAVDSVVTADEPSDVPMATMPYDTWLHAYWHHPLTDTELSTMIVVDGVPAGLCAIASDGHARVSSAMTGILREYRGRGLAKHATLHRARERGYTTAHAGNDGTNAPMLAINSWLGYQQRATETLHARAL